MRRIKEIKFPRNDTKIFSAMWSIWEFSLKTLLDGPLKVLKKRVFDLQSVFLLVTYQGKCGVYKESLLLFLNITFTFLCVFARICMYMSMSGNYSFHLLCRCWRSSLGSQGWQHMLLLAQLCLQPWTVVF